jgi:glycosyltransferase involved in cell wall biosynthesis
LRILYSHRTKSSDGQFVHIRALTEALAAIGHEVLICGPDTICTPEALGRQQLDAGAGEKKGLAGMLPKPAYEAAEYAYSLHAYQRLQKAARNFAPDIIYERANLFYNAGKWLKQSQSLPLILEVNAPLAEEREAHGGLWLKSLAYKQEQALWRAANHILPVSTPLADRIRKAGIDDKKITVIPNGVLQSQLTSGNGKSVRAQYQLQDKFVIGFTGFVREWHGVDRVLHWLATPEGQGAHLLLVGDGPAIPALRQLAEKLIVASRFHITGVVQREQLSNHIAAFDIALQPRVTEYASPLKLFDYMAQGRAIIAPDQSNISEILDHEKEALLFAPEQDSDFFAALNHLKNDGEKRESLGHAARKKLQEQDMTWAGNAKRVTRIAKALLT